MSWVVDTCVLIDVRMDDPNFGRASAACLEANSQDGLLLSPISFIEIAPTFRGDEDLQSRWLTNLNIDFAEQWTHADTRKAHQLWHDFIEQRR